MTANRRTLILVLLLFASSHAAISVSAQQGEGVGLSSLTLEDLERDLSHLASDSLAGRRAAREGELEAARYVASSFERAGLRPIDNDNYLQAFNIGLRRIQKATALVVRRGDDERTRKLGREYLPLFHSPDSSEAKDCEVVFVGYGIRAPEFGYDDYEGIDVQGKVVLVLRDEPGRDDPDSPFDGRDPTLHGEILTKAKLAHEQGAVGVLLVAGPLDDRSSFPIGQLVWPELERAGGPSSLFERFSKAAATMTELKTSNFTPKDIAEQVPRMLQSRYPKERAPIPVLSISRKISRALLKPSGHDLKAMQGRVLDTYQPASKELEGVRVDLVVEITTDQEISHNVIGWIPGRDEALSEQYVVVGAHIDHVGENSEGDVWNGADDNASGTAALMELAEAFGQAPADRSILFIGFGAEEQGLLGSAHFVEAPTVPLDSIVAMINLDMVGRGGSEVFVMGARSGPLLEEVVSRYDDTHGVDLLFDDKEEREFFARSDQANFYQKSIPVLFFTTMLHEDYHKPTDTVDKVDFETLLAITKVAFLTTRDLANSPQPSAFVRFLPTDDSLGGMESLSDSGFDR